jgi:hypothetical protein
MTSEEIQSDCTELRPRFAQFFQQKWNEQPMVEISWIRHVVADIVDDVPLMQKICSSWI